MDRRASALGFVGMLAEKQRVGCSPEHGQRQPQKKDELENKVKREPVDNVDEGLNNSKEGEDDPVLQRSRRNVMVSFKSPM